MVGFFSFQKEFRKQQFKSAYDDRHRWLYVPCFSFFFFQKMLVRVYCECSNTEYTFIDQRLFERFIYNNNRGKNGLKCVSVIWCVRDVAYDANTNAIIIVLYKLCILFGHWPAMLCHRIWYVTRLVDAVVVFFSLKLAIEKVGLFSLISVAVSMCSYAVDWSSQT